MKAKPLSAVLALSMLLAALAAGHSGLRHTALAQTSTSFNLEWHVIGGGGQPVSSANYVVNSTAGQGAASPPYSAGAQYVVSGGYWYAAPYLTYLPLVLKEVP